LFQEVPVAEYFTQFSCIFYVGSAENAERAEAIRGELAADLYREEGGYLGFIMSVDHEHGPGALHICSEDYGEPEHVIRFVLRCAEALGLQGIWGFAWALTCSRPRLDAFGGGAHVIDLGRRATVADLDCADWVNGHLDVDDHAAGVGAAEQQ
jgi:hypothetical protein